ncbi:MAG TPA: POTRA domain-containing protein, partial [Polyangiaceae bacterium]
MARLARLAQTWLSCCLACAALATPAAAEPDSPEGPVVSEAPELGPLFGRPVLRVDVEQVGGRWQKAVRVTKVRPGERFGADVARRAVRELLDTGRFASASVEAVPEGGGVRLVVRVVPRRIIADLRVTGNAVDVELVLRSAEITRGDALTPALLGTAARRVTEEHARRGYPGARTHVDTLDTDDPLAVVLDITVEPGPLERIVARRLRARPFPATDQLARVVRSYSVRAGAAADEAALEAADAELVERLRAAGFYQAKVGHELGHTPSGALLTVTVDAGLEVVLTFQGNRLFDDATLEAGLELEERTDRSAPALADALSDYYRRRGFWDVDVEASDHRRGGVLERRFDIVEGAPVRVVERRYPCLRGTRSEADVSAEIESFLTEELPGANFLGAVDPRGVDAALDPERAEARPPPFEPNPYETYDADVYARAVEHLEDLYRSEGYLSASVGPVELFRRICHPRSPPGRCVPLGVRAKPKVDCRLDAQRSPPEQAPRQTSFCVPDAGRGARCEPGIAMSIPIRLGPRTYLYDVAYAGNRAIVEAELAEVSELVLGEPVSQLELQRAGRRILDAYAEEGYAF